MIKIFCDHCGNEMTPDLLLKDGRNRTRLDDRPKAVERSE